MEISRLTRDGTAEPVSRDQILRHARGQGNVHFPCSADHEQDWQPYPVDPYSAICDDHTYIHTIINSGGLRGYCTTTCTPLGQQVRINTSMCVDHVCTYLCMVITYSKGKDQPGKVVNPARGQLNRENEFSPVPVRA